MKTKTLKGAGPFARLLALFMALVIGFGPILAQAQTVDTVGRPVALKAYTGVTDNDAAAYIARAAAAGYSHTGTEAAAVDRLVKDLKGSGVYGAIDEFWILNLAPTAYTLGVKGKYNLTVNGTVTFTKNAGVRGDGSTGYLDTGFNPTTGVSPNYELNSASVGVFAVDPTVRTANRLVGAGGGGGNLRLVARAVTGNAMAGYINDATGSDAVSSQTTAIPALFSIVRLGSADKRMLNNGRQLATFTTASTSVTNQNIVLLRDGANYGTEMISFAYVGRGLRSAEVAAISDAVTRYLVTTQRMVMAFGDSLTYGVNAAGNAQMASPWVNQVSTAIGRLIYQGGVPGETSTQIRVRVTSDDFGAYNTEIFWAGKNNVSAPATVISDVATMVAWNKSGKYIVIGVTPTTGNDDAIGTTNYANRIQINTALAAAYGSHYLDLLPPLQAANDNSANDLADVANGSIPRSLRWPSDSTHISDTVNSRGFSGAGVVAGAVQGKMTALGY